MISDDAKDILTAVGKYGGATIIALYLVFQLASNIPMIQSALATVEDQHSTMIGQITQLQGDLSIEVKRQTHVLQQICIHGARTNQQAQDCINQ